ncbi:PfkB family carbohydrate kinase [Nocardia sp. NPDC050710]|uniref:PfkB family carbohydrate kinase n=1 Tax=Nocardia sp. NPDC050710 TaxID=3157220 RepID=UPI0033E95283
MATPLFVGLSTLDIAYSVDTYPHEDTKTQARDQFLGAGGPAANAAVACAILSGESPLFITALGRHRLADIVRRDLDDHNVRVVDTTPDRADEPPVSSIVVARQSQSRTIVSLDGSRITAVFDAALDVHVHGRANLLIDGHYPDLALGIVDSARRAGVPVVLDAGRWKPVHDQLLPLVDIVICSEAFRPPGFAGDDVQLLDYIRARGPEHAAITRGPDPVLYSTGSRSGSIAVAAVDAIDTLGAGDILHGAFCHYHAIGHGFIGSLERASAVATLSCRSFGTRRWRDAISDLVK